MKELCEQIPVAKYHKKYFITILIYFHLIQSVFYINDTLFPFFLETFRILYFFFRNLSEACVSWLSTVLRLHARWGRKFK